MREKLPPMSKERFERYKVALEAKGYRVKNRWRKGTTTVNLADIVLSETTAPPQKGAE